MSDASLDKGNFEGIYINFLVVKFWQPMTEDVRIEWIFLLRFPLINMALDTVVVDGRVTSIITREIFQQVLLRYKIVFHLKFIYTEKVNLES